MSKWTSLTSRTSYWSRKAPWMAVAARGGRTWRLPGLPASALAAAEDIELSPEHWEILELLRSFYAEFQLSPATRPLIKYTALKLGPEKGNSLHLNRPDDPLLSGVREGDFVYYVHSFYATGCDGALAASSDYGGVTVAGAVRRGSVCGTQFHPEKSGEVGLAMLRNFAKLTEVGK